MKKLLVLVLFVALGVTLNAQRIEKSYAGDTCISGSIYFSYTRPILSSDGVLGFVFTKRDKKDSCTILRIQGAMESAFAGPVDLTGNASMTNTTTDGTTFLYVTDPAYLYYRLKATTANGDSVIFTNVKLVYK